MYTRNPAEVVAELGRVLKPGGILYLSAPFVYRYAPDGVDRFRFSVGGLKALAADFEEIQCGFNRGPASTMADMLSYFLAILTCFNNTRLFNVLVDAYQWGLFPLKYLDRIVGRYDVAQFIYSGAFFMGRKPATPE
jgi:SAM-dependent methyltransferase